MGTATPVYLLDVTSGRLTQLITYLQQLADALGRPRELGVIFPQDLKFDFSRIRVSVQLSEERLRYEDARQREQDRAAGIWADPETNETQRYAHRSREEYEKQATRSVVRDWEAENHGGTL
jgi:hypothetical protein